MDVSETPPEQLALPTEPDRIPVEPEVLAWARKSIGLDYVAAGKRIGLSAKTIEKWESNEASPTLAQLRKAANAYKRPLAVLLLPKPPMDFQALRDFRRADKREGGPSPELTAEHWRSRTQREVLLELADLGVMPDEEPQLPPRIAIDTDPEEAGAVVRRWLAIERVRWSKPRDALNAWIDAAEDLGVLVVQTHRVPTSEMRGFSVWEWPYPIIALNGADSPRGRLFTMVHEAAHLALNAGGICDLHEDEKQPADEDRIERYANRVAAAALMPRDELQAVTMVQRAAADRAWTLDELDSLATPFGTSSESMLLRLITLGKGSWDRYWELKPEWDRVYKEARARQREKEGGPSFYVVKARDLGPAYVRSVLDAFRSRSISSLDVADYLDIRYDQIPRLEAAAK